MFSTSSFQISAFFVKTFDRMKGGSPRGVSESRAGESTSRGEGP